MEILNTLGVVTGGAWASGVNLYLTVAGLGIAQRFGWMQLPGEMNTLAHPLVIIAALLLYGIEFFADKIPVVDSAWDSVHTFIRPVGGAALGYLAMADAGAAFQYPLAVLTGSIALDSHLTKATTRVAINTSPEPFTNSIASVTEDLSVAGILVLIANHPVIAGLLVFGFLLFSIWFLRKMFKFVKMLFRRKKNSKQDQANGVGNG